MLTPEIKAAIEDAKTSQPIRMQKIFEEEKEYVVFSNKNTPVILADALVTADAENERLSEIIKVYDDSIMNFAKLLKKAATDYEQAREAILRGDKVEGK
jgi:hypothetical protein